MAQDAPTYDLVMLLDADAEQTERAKLVADARAAIEAEGELLRHDDWGSRAMAYPIDRHAAAEYHLLQFHAPPSVIEELSHTLRITDGVLRFRIIKVRRGTPSLKAGAPPVVAAVASPGSAASDGGRPGRAPAPSAGEPEPEAAEPEAAPDAPEVSEEEPAQATSPAVDADAADGDGGSSPE